MSVHLNAKPGQIAETVLLPGDPLRAKHIAENFLENAEQHNDVRGMLGYTGTYKGHRISVQGSGMGIPSISIYVNELIRDYGCKKLIRVGTCGAYHEDVKVRDVILAQAASTDSQVNNIRFGGRNFAPIADFELLHQAYLAARRAGKAVRVGNIFSSDTFYNDHPDHYKIWADFGVLAVEMEAAGLYTIAAKYGVQALTILTVSDHLVTGEATTSIERQTSFNDMVQIALEAAIAENGAL
ncbi:purine-nucleoside phosphorylase [Deinococcus misasensis]|uniref:purine-nucleoside phosphorylase n=1 Tax=Deinococcus misasensis TaxID=392413 RepID=UPI000555C285|nr:purine-nucleoside phosphorylase [Deinococcus misasensis]